jgi:methionine-R-sulfoxide reductase
MKNKNDDQHTTFIWEAYRKPVNNVLKKMYTNEVFSVTQQNATERPYSSEWCDVNEEGIYVDVMSGEPLFLSKDKFDSGTGWPSFTRPIVHDAVVEKVDKRLFVTRTEIRSKYADNHLGHVFSDGPCSKGGLRYCINGASLQFIPLKDISGTDYERYLNQIADEVDVV